MKDYFCPSPDHSQWSSTVAGGPLRVLLEILTLGADTSSRPDNAGTDAIVTPDRSKATGDNPRILPFRPRGSTARGGGPGWRWHVSAAQPPAPPVEGLAKYEGGEVDDDNYRHRMMVNLAALAFTVVLAIAGAWLAIQIADMRRNQDCVLSGRRNCAPIDVKALER